jgi:hypothetical protein
MPHLVTLVVHLLSGRGCIFDTPSWVSVCVVVLLVTVQCIPVSQRDIAGPGGIQVLFTCWQAKRIPVIGTPFGIQNMLQHFPLGHHLDGGLSVVVRME